jgi:DNA polymerase-3 subunit epsilon
MRVARRVYPSLTSHALESLAKQLGVEYRGSAHRAGADAEVTAKLMVSLGRRLQSQYAGLPIDAALFKRIMKMPVAAAAKRLEVLALAAC